MTVGERIREIRKHKFTQAQLAEAIGVHVMTVRRWESGSRFPNAEDLQKLALALNTSIAYLTGETDDPTAKTSLTPEMIVLAENNSTIKGDNNFFMNPGTTAPTPGNNGAKSMSSRTPLHEEKSIVINVGDVHMEFPTGTPAEVIDRAIKSAKEASLISA
jgi:transcriptional regulator with XRE-family HTH domain